MPKKELLFFFAILLMGFLDWLTTVTGVVFFGATEANPLLFGLTKSSMIMFSAVKLSAVALAGAAFYKAAVISKPANSDWHFCKRFLDGGVSVTFLGLMAIVASNMVTILRI